MKDFMEKMKEFIKTPLGKVALVAIIILTIIFIAAFIFMAVTLLGRISGGTKEETKVPVKIEETTTTAKGGTEQTATVDSNTTDSAIFKVYEYKDPFQPLIKAESTSTTTTTTSTTTTTTDETSGSGSQVLEVQDIFEENGVEYASIKYGASVYKVTEGDRVDESPYEVLTIGETSVTLLYGDRKVEVNIGESILK